MEEIILRITLRYLSFKTECFEIIDDGIKQTSEIADEFWKFDRKTAYIVTTYKSTFLSWGSGILSNVENLELKFTDIAVMIAALLDINIPSHSIGKIPIEALNLNSKQRSEAKISNAKQLHEQVLNYEKYYYQKSDLIKKAYQGLDSQGLY